MSRVRRILSVSGTVQGVGFRPFVYRQAVALGLGGSVQNRPEGVRIELEGDAEGVDELLRSLRSEAPPLCRVERIDEQPAPPQGTESFSILSSETAGACATCPPVDVAPCEACLAELSETTGRRGQYAFTNCTHCGPRYSIVRSLPYDRMRTSMAEFALCADCAREYSDPQDRRYHAEPNACSVCGPQLDWEGKAGRDANEPPLQACVRALKDGGVVAIKGVGGFHLACDARSNVAVHKLRERKQRAAKPLALLAPSLEVIRAHAELSPAESACLTSPRRPIVLLRRRADSDISPEVTKGLAEVGFMLPPSPLHHLLAVAFAGPLVMTSGNLAEEPIATENDEARTRLGGLCDGFLFHDRTIAVRLDDSVVRVERGDEHVLRRGRGYAPEPIPFCAPRPLLAAGADLKNTLALADAGRAVVSQHIGDLHHPETRAAWRRTLSELSALLGITPAAVACDRHPDYASTLLAESLHLPMVRVQHHHAHVAACLAEHELHEQVLAVVFDGAGFGDDGMIWGGEVLIADRIRAVRAAHLRYVRMPGGEAAAREPWRMALSYLVDSGESVASFDLLPGRPAEVELLRRAMRRGVSAPLTSSAGRLFDAVAALTGLCRVGQFEAQAAMLLEANSDPTESPYRYSINEPGADLPAEIDLRPALRAIVRDVLSQRPVSEIGGRFHATLAASVAEVVSSLSRRHGLSTVVLTGGCFQNVLLSGALTDRLERGGLHVVRPLRFPPSDGGISLGQLAVAAAQQIG